jgi:hypothetical protein
LRGRVITKVFVGLLVKFIGSTDVIARLRGVQVDRMLCYSSAQQCHSSVTAAMLPYVVTPSMAIENTRNVVAAYKAANFRGPTK